MDGAKYPTNIHLQENFKSRFSNLVVPLGLQFYPISNETNDNDNDNENHQFIHSKKFNNLFYSVGKDLGIYKSKTYKNRTMKNPTK